MSDERPRTTLVDGSPVTSDHRDLKPNGQQKDYVVLSAEERAKGTSPSLCSHEQKCQSPGPTLEEAVTQAILGASSFTPESMWPRKFARAAISAYQKFTDGEPRGEANPMAAELDPRSLEQLIAAEPGDTPRRRKLQRMFDRVKAVHPLEGEVDPRSRYADTNVEPKGRKI